MATSTFNQAQVLHQLEDGFLKPSNLFRQAIRAQKFQLILQIFGILLFVIIDMLFGSLFQASGGSTSSDSPFGGVLDLGGLLNGAAGLVGSLGLLLITISIIIGWVGVMFFMLWIYSYLRENVILHRGTEPKDYYMQILYFYVITMIFLSSLGIIVFRSFYPITLNVFYDYLGVVVPSLVGVFDIIMEVMFGASGGIAILITTMWLMIVSMLGISLLNIEFGMEDGVNSITNAVLTSPIRPEMADRSFYVKFLHFFFLLFTPGWLFALGFVNLHAFV